MSVISSHWTASPFYFVNDPTPIPNETLETLPHLSLRLENLVQSATFDKVLKEILSIEEGEDIDVLILPNGENIKVKISSSEEWIPLITPLGTREDIIERTDLSDRLDLIIRELFCKTIRNPRERREYKNIQAVKYFQENRLQALIQSNRTISIWSDPSKNIFEKFYLSIFSFIATYYYIMKNALV